MIRPEMTPIRFLLVIVLPLAACAKWGLGGLVAGFFIGGGIVAWTIPRERRKQREKRGELEKLLVVPPPLPPPGHSSWDVSPPIFRQSEREETVKPSQSTPPALRKASPGRLAQERNPNSDDSKSEWITPGPFAMTNSRVAEMLADELAQMASKQRWPRNPFLLHHGSLSKEVREDVEVRLKRGEPVSVFCTSTLEMGIDIGSVHSVGQLGPPWSVASLVQRLGRSGRKEGESAILRLYSLDAPPSPKSSIEELLCPQLLRSIALVELMLVKWLEPFDTDSPQFSTLIHQILSVLRQTGGCTAKQINDVLVRQGAFRDVSDLQFAAILRSLGANQLIEQIPTGEIILAPMGEAITHAKEFYAAFTGVTEYSIRHDQLDIGKLPEDAIPPEGEHLLLNGRRWKVEAIDNRSMVVEVVPARGKKVPIFGGNVGEIHKQIAMSMCDVLQGKSTYAYLQADAAKLLECVRAYAAKLRIFELPWVDRGGSCVVFPWTGSKGIQALRACAQADGIEVEMESISIIYRCNSAALAQHFSRVSDGQFDVGALAATVGNKHRDKFDLYLPEELLDFANSRRLLSLKDAVAAVDALMHRGAGAGK